VRRTLLLVLAAALAAGCGSSGEDTATFEEDGFGITFRYPGEMKEAKNVTIRSDAGNAAKATAGIGYGKRDVIIVQRYDLNTEIGEHNLDRAKAELDPLVSSIAPGAPSGKSGKTRGFPSIEYDHLKVTSVPGADTRLVALFDGDVEYLVNCQSTRAHRAELDRACEQALKTVEKR
jgi:hypothetical protein